MGKKKCCVHGIPYINSVGGEVANDYSIKVINNSGQN